MPVTPASDVGADGRNSYYFWGSLSKSDLSITGPGLVKSIQLGYYVRLRPLRGYRVMHLGHTASRTVFKRKQGADHILSVLSLVSPLNSYPPPSFSLLSSTSPGLFLSR